MKHARHLLIPVAALLFLVAGCYTQLYRPDMEQANQHQQATLYNRYDSTAIDTTLRRDTTQYYPYPDYGWSYWGSPRPAPLWGWDYDYYMPNYYWGYFGYDSYYGTPWWHNWYDPYSPYYHGGGGVGEPPSKRPGGRRSHDTGGSYVNPPSSGNSAPPTYANPPAGGSTTPSNPPANNGDDGKRSGKRGH